MIMQIKLNRAQDIVGEKSMQSGLGRWSFWEECLSRETNLGHLGGHDSKWV